MTSGNIKAWLKKAGDELKAGDGIAEIETDKAVVTFETVDDGYLARVLVPGGSNDVPVGRPVAITVEDKADIAAFESYVPPDATSGAAAAAAPTPAIATPAAQPAPVPSTPSVPSEPFYFKS